MRGRPARIAKRMRVVFITTHPPDRGNLAEYGSYLAAALSRVEGISHVHVLANRVPNAPAKEQLSPQLSVHRVWDLDRPLSILRLVERAARLEPDVVHVNAGIRTWGPSRVASFAGALLCSRLKRAAPRVVLTLHTIGDTVKLEQFQEVGLATRAGMKVATHLYLSADIVTVTLRSIQRTLEYRFGARNVVVVPLGSYGLPRDKALTDSKRILTFGFWGVFKDADMLVAAVESLRGEGIDAELVLGGGPHPYYPEIYAQLRARYEGVPYVQFTGYVPEGQIGDLFTSSAAVVLPYRTNAGASAVMNVARNYGRPIIISADPGLMEQMQSEGGASFVFGNPAALVDALRRVLSDPSLVRRMGDANLEVAKRNSLDVQAKRYAQLYRSGITLRDVAVASYPPPMPESTGSEALPWPDAKFVTDEPK